MVSSMGYMVHGYESTGYMVSGVLGYRVRGTQFLTTQWKMLLLSCVPHL